MPQNESLNVFITHGHDREAMLDLRNFIKERLNHVPVVLSEQPDDGLTIVEKLEQYSEGCSHAIVLLSADDEISGDRTRVRQNVVHEVGFFHVRMGRAKVLLLKEVDAELFSNISGLIYKEYKRGQLSAVFEDVRVFLERNKEIEQVALTVKEGNKNSTMTAILFSMGGAFMMNTAQKLLAEIEALEAAGLSQETLNRKVRALLEAELTHDRDSRAKTGQKLEAKDASDKSEAGLMDLMAVPVYQGMDYTIEVLERCLADLKDMDLSGTEKMALCKSRLAKLMKEGKAKHDKALFPNADENSTSET